MEKGIFSVQHLEKKRNHENVKSRRTLSKSSPSSMKTQINSANYSSLFR